MVDPDAGHGLLRPVCPTVNYTNEKLRLHKQKIPAHENTEAYRTGVWLDRKWPGTPPARVRFCVGVSKSVYGPVLGRPGLPGSSGFCDPACPAGYLRRCNWCTLTILLIFKTPELNSEKKIKELVEFSCFSNFISSVGQLRRDPLFMALQVLRITASGMFRLSLNVFHLSLHEAFKRFCRPRLCSALYTHPEVKL